MWRQPILKTACHTLLAIGSAMLIGLCCTLCLYPIDLDGDRSQIVLRWLSPGVLGLLLVFLLEHSRAAWTSRYGYVFSATGLTINTPLKRTLVPYEHFVDYEIQAGRLLQPSQQLKLYRQKKRTITISLPGLTHLEELRNTLLSIEFPFGAIDMNYPHSSAGIIPSISRKQSSQFVGLCLLFSCGVLASFALIYTANKFESAYRHWHVMDDPIDSTAIVSEILRSRNITTARIDYKSDQGKSYWFRRPVEHSFNERFQAGDPVKLCYRRGNPALATLRNVNMAKLQVIQASLTLSSLCILGLGAIAMLIQRLLPFHKKFSWKGEAQDNSLFVHVSNAKLETVHSAFENRLVGCGLVILKMSAPRNPNSKFQGRSLAYFFAKSDLKHTLIDARLLVLGPKEASKLLSRLGPLGETHCDFIAYRCSSEQEILEWVQNHLTKKDELSLGQLTKAEFFSINTCLGPFALEDQPLLLKKWLDATVVHMHAGHSAPDLKGKSISAHHSIPDQFIGNILIERRKASLELITQAAHAKTCKRTQWHLGAWHFEEQHPIPWALRNQRKKFFTLFLLVGAPIILIAMVPLALLGLVKHYLRKKKSAHN